ncbi:Cmx/CmrA family chloramphenicol efflux MFS transporter [Streptomyces candidus]|uniref:DHA1 family chloramphenicol resistance protein-like MFS transporter n=1 Tax=Streptomyces candidus TaxID=67283 RepID=A0A7X0LT69_9ACTN|nr:Cmx/CmrA family chloramphenicol efflux MFS transporter [Streptomyces candidus]MBB6438706.1 DHA1 family chloramphenicol resistance protein-like MFS transporter [Streptomyces candidus]GHH53297.1 putative chloramphenicol resistance protein [Streptomyces candidus]
MPFALYLLGLAVFAQGTSEFMLAGLGPDIARDLDVSLPAAGALTSAFAVGMVLGAPLTALLSVRWPRRFALLVFLAVFLLVHVVGAVTDSFAVLLVSRVVGALANAGFLAVALVTAVGMVPPDAKGRATSVLLGGVTLACVVGVPAGAWIGQLRDWRAAFWAVALLAVPALAAVPYSVPGGRPRYGRVGVRRELRALRSGRLLLTLFLGALVNGATFCTFTYLAPLATRIGGVAEAWVPAVLALFGLGSFVGVAVGGRIVDVRPGSVLVGGGVVLCGGWALFAVVAGNPAVLFVLVFVQGALSFGVGSALISQALYAGEGAPTLAGACATAAFNVGAAMGPWAGGATIGVGWGLRSPSAVSALLVLIALVSAGAGRRVWQRQRGPVATLVEVK